MHVMRTCFLLRGQPLHTAAVVQRKRFATKEGLSGMRRAARFAEDTAVLI